MSDILSGVAGLCGGIISGSALCAFYIALGVFSKSIISLGLKDAVLPVSLSNAAGGIFGALITIFDLSINSGVILPGLFGLFAGIYVGIFIACLADIVDSIPVIKNFGISNNYIAMIFLAVVAGKMTGSLIFWIFGGF